MRNPDWLIVLFLISKLQNFHFCFNLSIMEDYLKSARFRGWARRGTDQIRSKAKHTMVNIWLHPHHNSTYHMANPAQLP